MLMGVYENRVRSAAKSSTEKLVPLDIVAFQKKFC